MARSQRVSRSSGVTAAPRDPLPLRQQHRQRLPRPEAELLRQLPDLRRLGQSLFPQAARQHPGRLLIAAFFLLHGPRPLS